MNARKITVIVAPLLLLVAMGGLRWIQWKNDHPPVTAQDARLRSILLSANWGMGSTQEFSLAQRQELAEHFWIATTSIEAQVPSPGNGTKVELYFHPYQPGQGHLFLNQDPAFDCLLIEWWHE